MLLLLDILFPGGHHSSAWTRENCERYQGEYHSLPGANDRDSVFIGVSVPESIRGQDGELHLVIRNIKGENVGITDYDLLLLK